MVPGGQLVAICYIGEKNLNALMVSIGAAAANRQQSEDYVDEENSAKAARRGIWQNKF